MSELRVDFFRERLENSRRLVRQRYITDMRLEYSDSLAWCLDRALASILSRRIEGVVCFVRFYPERSRFNAYLSHPCLVVDADSPELIPSVFLGGSRFLSFLELYESDLDECAESFERHARRLAAFECLKACLDEGIEVPSQLLDRKRYGKKRRDEAFGTWTISEWIGFAMKDATIEWVEENCPDLFASALERSRECCFRTVSSKFEGAVETILERVPICADDEILSAYDPPIFPNGKKAMKFRPMTYNLSSIIELMGYSEPFACELNLLRGDDGSIRIDLNSSFMSTELVDTDFGFVIVEAAKAGFVPRFACDWEAGEEYISRLAAALRMGIPFADLVAGESRQRIVGRMVPIEF